MARSAADALRTELGSAASAMPDLKDLDEEVLTRLAGQVRAAKKRQRQLLEASAESSLRFVPALLRGAVRKVLFG
jgi:hypothetical protein